MASRKYDPETFPVLVEGYARRGLTEEQIAHNLGVCYSTFRIYKQKYQAVLSALKKGREITNIIVENALYKRAIGYKVTDEHQEIKTMKDGSKQKIIRKKTSEIPPDVGAIVFWLKNRLPDLWKDNPGDGGTGEDYAQIFERFAETIRHGDVRE